MQSKCVECGELKDDPEEFTDGLRCTQCVEQALSVPDPRESMLFLLRTPVGDMWVNGAEMDRVTALGASLRHGPKGDLYHVGCVGYAWREERLQRFLEKQQGHEERAIQQRYALITKYMPMRYGWTR